MKGRCGAFKARRRRGQTTELALIKIEGGEGRAERPAEALGEFIVETMVYWKLLTELDAPGESQAWPGSSCREGVLLPVVL